jgi:hypothetical protein
VSDGKDENGGRLSRLRPETVLLDRVRVEDEFKLVEERCTIIQRIWHPAARPSPSPTSPAARHAGKSA